MDSKTFKLWKCYARKLLVICAGSIVLLVGVIMIVTPGPALLVIPAGLGILAIEFGWARHLLEKFHRRFMKAKKWIQNSECEK